jgi:hypothetical protein
MRFARYDPMIVPRIGFDTVIPGPTAGRNPESRPCRREAWIPGFALTRAPE